MDELESAELIILTMLNVMTDRQKALVFQQLQAAFFAGETMTRYHARRTVIERATVVAKAPPRS